MGTERPESAKEGSYGFMGHSQCQTLEGRSRRKEGWTPDLCLLLLTSLLSQIPFGQIQLELEPEGV